jgi:hypothetical protein
MPEATKFKRCIRRAGASRRSPATCPYARCEAGVGHTPGRKLYLGAGPCGTCDKNARPWLSHCLRSNYFYIYQWIDLSRQRLDPEITATYPPPVPPTGLPPARRWDSGREYRRAMAWVAASSQAGPCRQTLRPPFALIHRAASPHQIEFEAGRLRSDGLVASL